MKPDWLANESREILSEKMEKDYKSKKKRYNQDTFVLIMYFLMMIPILTLSLHAEELPCYELIFDNEEFEEPIYLYKDEGVFFTCKRCRTSQWQSSRNANWRGEYFCRKCGTKMGDE